MAGERNDYTLGEIASFAYGKMPKSNVLTVGDYPTYSGYKYQYKYPEYNCDKGDVIVVARGVGGTGDVKIVKERCYLTNLSIKIMLDSHKADNLYFYYNYLNSSLRHLDSGSAQSQITINDLVREPLTLPPLAEQKAIAAVLGALDDKIELNRRMNETLEAVAQSLFKSWFVDDTQSALPKGWRESTVDDEFNLTMGQSPPGESYNETGDGIPFYQGRTDFGFRFPTARVFCTAPTRFANAGDTLGSVRAPVGSVNMATEKCSVGRGVAAARHKSGSRSYTYYFMRSLEADFACFEGEGTVFGSINKADFHAIKRAAPPSEIIEAFEKMLFPIDQRIENNEKESRTLAALRDALLPKLLSGELRVPAAAKLVEATT